jgi:hypothetical protein
MVGCLAALLGFLRRFELLQLLEGGADFVTRDLDLAVQVGDGLAQLGAAIQGGGDVGLEGERAVQ